MSETPADRICDGAPGVLSLRGALRRISLSCARRPMLRQLGHAAFRAPGLGRVLRRGSEAVLPSEERVWMKIPAGVAKGLWLKVLPKWEVGYLQGCAEAGMNDALQHCLKTGGCFYDLGAHIGFYSLMAARLVGQTGSVVAFEPDPGNAEILRENAARNSFDNISVVCAAVSNQDGEIEFQVSSGDGPSRMSGRVVKDHDPPSCEQQTVRCPAISLDSFVSSHRSPDLIKIDVEGAELEVLNGTRSLLLGRRPALIVEIHNPKDLPVLSSNLACFGYKLRPLGTRRGSSSARNFFAEVTA